MELQKNLLPRHIRFMALGGAIGTGIFKGTSETVSIAGPAVIFSYLFAGLLLLVVMSAIAEMAIAFPGLNMKGFIRKAFGTRVSFVIGWLYCFMWLVVCVIEVIAAGSFLQYWFPSMSLWSLSFISAIFIVAVNFMNVKRYGEIEFWFAGIKITMIVLFIALGAGILFGIIPSDHSGYVQNYVQHKGFFPHGWSGVFSALLIVIFSYGGSELIGLTLTETKDAEKVIPKVIKGVIWRIVLFYTLPILIICGLIPWNEIGNQESPFVQVLSTVGFQGSAHIMNFVLITAVLSAANSGIYGCTRMMYSLATEGEAPKAFAKISKNGVPVYTVIVSAIILIGGTFVAYFSPDRVFGYLMAIPGFTVSLVWISICLAQLKLRKTYTKMPHFKVWGFPYITSFTVIALGVSCVAFAFSEQNRLSIFVCLGMLIVLILCSFINGKKQA
ncbi:MULTISPECIES: amino acid permease [Bacillaceae]|uniref:GABA permease (4-amino butyrate transport carrier) n=1 Tax=Gottfriedia luciferensis TaxID=178774 RepID=A0ABX2ZNN9_9BACI|nr:MULTISPECIES: amino acid permease [Bacillaceae]ODG90806.1 GABA permease (4-amino butyrate transport carrier) [Gottfriedia luciferensis]PGZ87471.1 amino acid permease [Bacillus sp. AFS029533]SFD29086.1 amino acid transporter, AAT family [Bacillus sp. UNCCL81]